MQRKADSRKAGIGGGGGAAAPCWGAPRGGWGARAPPRGGDAEEGGLEEGGDRRGDGLRRTVLGDREGRLGAPRLPEAVGRPVGGGLGGREPAGHLAGVDPAEAQRQPPAVGEPVGKLRVEA